jgi:hypothetical protein
MYACPSARSPARPHGTVRLQLEALSWHFIFEYFPKICQENSSLIKIWQEQRVLTWRPMYICDNTSMNSSQNEKYFRQKL